MSNKVEVNHPGFPILGLLGVAFVVLKLMGYITWSWWLVLAPFWIPVALAGIFLVIALYIAFKT